MKQLKDLLKTEMNGESVRRHVYLLTEKMTADDDDDDNIAEMISDNIWLLTQPHSKIGLISRHA